MKVYVIAGEASGDRLGGALMAGLKELAPDVQFAGIGGYAMQAQGLESLFDMTELSVMGLAEILPKYRHFQRRISETVDDILARKPDVLITIDLPEFCLRVARRLKAVSDIRTVHYVAPTVWAWRAGRAEKMARYIDQVLALFPFEPPYMEAAGIACDFVGHPVVEEPVASSEDIATFRGEHGLGEAPIVLALPGSRRAEVDRLAPIFGEALRPLIAANPDMRVVVPAAPAVAEAVVASVARWPGDPIVLDPRARSRTEALAEKRAGFAAAGIALAASGTVSLELAAAGTPMVIAYDMNWFSRQLIARLATVDTVTLVNLVSETRAVPEFLGPDCRPPQIAEGLKAVLAAPEAQHAAMALSMERLGRGGEAPGLRAARAVLDRM